MRSFQDYTLYNEMFKRFAVKKISMHPKSQDLYSIFKKYPKLVIALNHGPMMAPGYVNTSLLDLLVKNGAAERTYVAVVWKHFYRIPGLGKLVRYATQVKQPTSVEGFLELFTDPKCNDLLVMPEGENCSYGNGVDIEPFLSPRFLEIAIKADAPVLLSVHHGTHLLATPVEISEKQTKWFKWAPKKSFERIQEARLLSLPKPRRSPLPKMEFMFQLYKPSLSAKELSDNKFERLEQLQQEAEVVRAKMQEMVNILAGKAETPSPSTKTKSSEKVTEIAA